MIDHTSIVPLRSGVDGNIRELLVLLVVWNSCFIVALVEGCGGLKRVRAQIGMVTCQRWTVLTFDQHSHACTGIGLFTHGVQVVGHPITGHFRVHQGYSNYGAVNFFMPAS